MCSKSRAGWPGPWGAAAGTVQGATGISASIVGPYYHASGLGRETYAFGAALTFMMISVAQFTAMGTVNLLTTDRLGIGLIAIIPTLLFTRIGIGWSRKISEQTFNRVLIVLFVLMEIRLVTDITWP